MLAKLTREQRKALMELLIHLARSDGRVDDVEKNLLYQYAHLNGVESCELRNDRKLEELVAPLESAASRVVVISELLRLRHAHAFFAAEETSAIVDAAAVLGVPMDLLPRIEEWVMDDLELADRAEELLAEAEAVVHVDPQNPMAAPSLRGSEPPK